MTEKFVDPLNSYNNFVQTGCFCARPRVMCSHGRQNGELF